MIDYISGTIKKLTPTSVIIENAGVGHIMEISLQTYDRLEGKADAIIYIQSQINQREGTQIDYGFSSEEERAYCPPSPLQNLKKPSFVKMSQGSNQ